MSRRFKGRPVAGLPSKLPAGEQMLWQGAPDWRALTRHAFRVRLVAIYFAALVVWRIAGSLAAGHGVIYALNSGVSSLMLAAAAIGIFGLLAWLMSRSTTYSITNRRVVMTYGMALPKSLNLPFCRIDAVDLLAHPDGSGDIVLRLPAKTRLSYLLLWPHARAGTTGAVPVLRCLGQPETVARLLAGAIGQTVAPAAGATVAVDQMMQAQAA